MAKSSETEFSNHDVDISSRDTVYEGFLRVDCLQLKHKCFEGGWSAKLQRELLVKTPAVGILLYDPRRDDVVLVRQFRVGALQRHNSPWLLELVAGMVGEGEAQEAVAIRESKEEANCEPRELVKICDYYSSPGASDEKVTLFCGRVDSVDAGGVFGLAAENEDIQVVVLSFPAAYEAVTCGDIDNAMSVIALQWLKLHKAELLQRWQ